MRFLIFGTGAIGTYIGSSLLNSNQDVVFVDVDGVVKTIRETGLVLDKGNKIIKIDHPLIVENLPDAFSTGAFDAGIVAVKSYDTEILASSLTPHKSALRSVVCLQNGVENESVLSSFLGNENVIAGTLTSAVRKVGPGHVVLERQRGIGLVNTHNLSAELARAFKVADLNPRLYENSDAMKWSKLLTNLIGNATSAILDMTPAEIYSHPDLYRIEKRQIQEALLVMRRRNISIVDLPGTPVKLLAAMMTVLPNQVGRFVAPRALGSGRGGKMPSFHIDLRPNRRRSEVDYLNGAVVRKGEEIGISTPINRYLTQTLLDLTEGQLSLDKYSKKPELFYKDCPV